MSKSTIYKKLLLAELGIKLKNFGLAFHLFTQLNGDTTLQKNLYLYSSVLFGLGLCHVYFERYDVAYVQFMKANTLWPTSPWASMLTENAMFCIEALGGETLALERFRKNTKENKNIDSFLSIAYHAYHLETVRKKALDKALKHAHDMIKIIPLQEATYIEAAHKKSIATALKTSYCYLSHALELDPNNTLVLGV